VGFRVEGLVFGVQGLGFKRQGSGCRITKFRESGSDVRGVGLEFRKGQRKKL
jgi:hypothetical protein